MAIFIAVPFFFDKNYWPQLTLNSPLDDVVAIMIIGTIVYNLFVVAKK